MPRRFRNLALAGGIAVAVALFAAGFLLPSADPAPSGGSATTEVDEVADVPAAAPSPTATSPRSVTPERRIYAVSLPRLQGLAATAAPGTRLELWVAWEPPITKAPRFQKLREDVVLEEIVPPPIPEAPPTALLSVDEAGVADLLYADRFGALTVTVVPDR